MEACGLRAVFVRGVNGRCYLLAANPAASESKATILAPEGKWMDLVSGKCVDSVGSVCVVIPPEGAVLLAEQQH